MGDARWRRIPVKTDASTTFFVMHDFIREIGFTKWAAGPGEKLFGGKLCLRTTTEISPSSPV